MTRVLIAGVSTRAAAASAARAGFAVTALDGYADRDQHPSVRALALPRDFELVFTAQNAAAAAASVECDAVAYLSNFENQPDAVATLAANRTLWGNPPDVLRLVRDPFAVAAIFRAHGIAAPNVSNDSHDSHDSKDSNPSAPSAWLLKPLSSGGGHAIRQAPASGVTPRGFYRQQWISGTPGSIVFLAAAGRAVPLGISRQLIGDARFGASGYRYCGSVLAPIEDPQFENGLALEAAAHDVASIAAAEFGLVGLNGIDFIARSGTPHPIEINPRWSASMELVERAFGVTLFALHATACVRGVVPAPLVGPRRAVGKAIVFARDACIAGDTDDWLANPDIRDVPHAGDPFVAGTPVCTVLAEAADAATCEAALAASAKRIFADMRRWRSDIHDSRLAIHDSHD